MFSKTHTFSFFDALNSQKQRNISKKISAGISGKLHNGKNETGLFQPTSFFIPFYCFVQPPV